MEAVLTRGLGLDGYISMRFATRLFAQSATLLPNVVDSWLKRSNQISVVEMFAPPLALCTLGQRVRRKDYSFSSTPRQVEGELVRGCSARSDMCLLTGAFWHLCATEEICIYMTKFRPIRTSRTGLRDVLVPTSLSEVLSRSKVRSQRCFANRQCGFQRSRHLDTWCL